MKIANIPMTYGLNHNGYNIKKQNNSINFKGNNLNIIDPCGSSVVDRFKDAIGIPSQAPICIGCPRVVGDVNTIFQNIKLFNNSTVTGDVKTDYGDITLTGDSEIEGSAIAENGKVTIEESDVGGNVVALNDIIISDDSCVDGCITSKKGEVLLSDSTALESVRAKNFINVKNSQVGSVYSECGRVSIQDSIISGQVKAKIDNLELNGNNKIGDLVLTDKSEYDKDLVKTPVKTPEFTIPKGTEVNGCIEFQTETPGILYVEDGAKIDEKKVINAKIEKMPKSGLISNFMRKFFK